MKRLKCDKCKQRVSATNKFDDKRFYCPKCGQNLGIRETKQYREKICEKCNLMFKIQTPPKGIGKKGTAHSPKLCDDCWKKAKTGLEKAREQRKLVIPEKRLNLNIEKRFLGSFSKSAREEIKLRNIEIRRLNEVVEQLSLENYKLKEEKIMLEAKKCKQKRSLER